LDGPPAVFTYLPGFITNTTAHEIWAQLKLGNPQAFGTWGTQQPKTLFAIAIASVFFGMVGALFSEGIEVFKHFYSWLLPKDKLVINGYSTVHLVKPLVGGFVVTTLWILFSSQQNPFYLPDKYDGTYAGVDGYKYGDPYLGLGTGTPGFAITTALQYNGVDFFTFLWKTLFTCLTLAAGYKGGEVTPIFFIGAAAGNTAAWVLNEDPELFASLGLCAVFAAATNTPMACTIMGFELFGGMTPLYFGLACFTAYTFSGNTGIYVKQYIAKACKSASGDIYTYGDQSQDGVTLEAVAKEPEPNLSVYYSYK